MENASAGPGAEYVTGPRSVPSTSPPVNGMASEASVVEIEQKCEMNGHELRLSNARLAIFHELGPRESVIWQKCERNRQNEYAELIVNGLASAAAAQRFIRDSYLP
jgi:hypothetical protein